MEGREHYRGYLKRRILIPLTVVIVLTLILFSFTANWYVSNAIKREAQNHLTFAEQSYKRDLVDEAEKLAGYLELITDDPHLRDALIAQQPEQLLALSSHLYQHLNTSQHITHFYFTLPDRTNLLRVHNPPRHGDRIDRITTLRAEQTGNISSGIELGPLGTFTLRVVKPWIHEGKLIGYIELGEEIDHIIDGLRHDLGIDLFVLINKKNLKRAEWEEGMRMLGRNHNWDEYPNHILASSPDEIKEIPNLLEQQLSHYDQIAMNNLIDVAMPAHHFKATFIPLMDVRDERIGMMLLLTPTDHWIAQGQRSLLGVTLIMLMLGSVIFALFYRLSNSTEKTLDETRLSLIDESQKNTALQNRHIKELEASNQQLEQTSRALRISHDRLEEAQRLTHMGSWEWDIASGALNWSNEVYRIFGIDPANEAVTYHRFLMAIPPQQRQQVEEAVASALQNRAPYEVEHKIIHTDGTERIVQELGEIITDSDGKALRMVGTVQDITQRREAEQASRRLAQILNSASNEIYLLAPDTLHVEQANQTAKQHLGYSDAELYHLDYLQVLDDHDQEEFAHIAAPLFSKERREVTFTGWHRCKGGERYPVEVRLQYSKQTGHPQLVAFALDISERQKQQEALQHQALHDALTGLPNRTLIGEQISHEIARARREGLALTLVQLDLYHFREINDTLGHDIGDTLLRAVAERLRSSVRESDMVARITGDEFYLLLPESGLNESMQLIQQLQDAIGAPFQIGDLSLNIEFNAGIAIFPEHAQDGSQLMRNTDIALNRAKTQRSGIELYRPEFDPYSVRRLMLHSQMRLAIERNEFQLYYQAKVASHSRRIGEAEALIRWNHPEQGFISPGEFIPLAEESGYIKQLTLWVIEEAARQLAEWRACGHTPTIAVNLSARNLQDPDLTRFIVDTVGKYAIEHSQLAFEITESTVMRDPDYTLGILNDLDTLGHPIAIDDYGTGYSSLSYLRRLPASELKIDLSFIRTMLDDDDSAIIVCSTIEMAHHLGLKVTAEGVENSDLAEILTIIDADMLQGYYFSKPLPAEEFFALLTADA